MFKRLTLIVVLQICMMNVVHCGRIESLRMDAMCSNQCRSLAGGADFGRNKCAVSSGSYNRIYVRLPALHLLALVLSWRDLA